MKNSILRLALAGGLTAVLAGFFILGAPATRASAQTSTPYLVDLGAYSAPQYARSINNSHQILLNGPNDVLWKNGALTYLGAPDGFETFTGNSLNESGVVTGYAYATDGAQRAFLWENGSFTPLGYLGTYNDISFSYGNAANTAGQVVGVSTTDTPYVQGFFYEDGAMTQLPYLNLPAPRNCDPFNCGAAPYDINDAQQIIGVSASNETFLDALGGCCAVHASAWYPDEEGELQVHALDTTFATTSVPYQINNSGAVVGAKYDYARQAARPMLWDVTAPPDTGQDLLDGNPDYDQGFAYGINSAGDIVGNMGNTETGVGFAFLYRDGQFTDLNTLLPPDSPWRLTTAFAINDQGDITGRATLNGSERVFLFAAEQPILSGSVVNTTDDISDAAPGDGICDTVGGDSLCSLRGAIQEANAGTGKYTITFAIPGDGSIPTIAPNSALPTITQPVIIDGTTQPVSGGGGDSSISAANHEGTEKSLPRAQLANLANRPVRNELSTDGPDAKVELNGENAGDGVDGLTITAGDSTIKGLVINRFKAICSNYFTCTGGGNGIVLQTNGGNIVRNNVVGTSAVPISGGGGDGFSETSAATALFENQANGILIDNSPNNTVGGTGAGANAGNLISGNRGNGILIRGAGSSGNLVAGNKIGTDHDGTSELENIAHGIEISGAPNNTIGGTSSNARNLIAGNLGTGIFITGGDATGTLVAGNFIGTNIQGNGALGNGIYLNAPNNTVGGTDPGARNIIAGGVTIAADNNTVQGNYIGTDVSGMYGLGSTGGISIYGSNNTIGGSDHTAQQCDRACNLISGGSSAGVDILANDSATRSGNIVRGNFIGVDITGAGALGNIRNGVIIQNFGNVSGAATNNLIEDNVISANGFGDSHVEGVLLSGPRVTQNSIVGNHIGTSADGTIALGNAAAGISLVRASSNVIGSEENGNVIAANGADGISLYLDSDQNSVQGNHIGTNDNDSASFGNGVTGILIAYSNQNTILSNTIVNSGFDGVSIYGTADENVIRNNYIGTNSFGTNMGNILNGISIYEPFLDPGPANNSIGGSTGQGNTIAYNGQNGVMFINPNNPIRGNRIFGNALLGIDAGDNGADTSSLPVVTDASRVNGSVTMQGTYQGAANTTYHFDFFVSSACDASGKGEGENWLGSASVSSDANGVVNFNPGFVTNANGNWVTATVTKPDNTTYEFSLCRSTIPTYAATYAAPNGDCGGSTPCYDSAQEAITATEVGGTVNLAGGTYDEALTLDHNVTLTFTGDTTLDALSIQAGSVNAPGGVLAMTGDLSNTGGAFNANGGTVKFTGNGNHTLDGAFTFHSLIVEQGNHLFVNQILDATSVTRSGMVTSTLAPNSVTNERGPVSFVDAFNHTTLLLTSTGSYDLGSTTLSTTIGGTPPACGSEIFPAAAVQRYFEITPTETNLLSATVRLYFDPAELNGVAPEDVAIYHCAGTIWESLGGTTGSENGMYFVEVPGVSSFSPFGLGGAGAPTGVMLANFKARVALNPSPELPAVRLNWRTASELKLVGFNVWRSENGGEDVQLNAALIPAKNPGTIGTTKYKYMDKNVVAGRTYTYYLQLLVTNGESEMSESVTVAVHDNSCAQAPGAVTLQTPANGEKTKRKLTLDWSQAACATRYELLLRRGGKKGTEIVRDDTLTGSEYSFTNLEKGKYQWRARACNATGCGKWAKWSKFVVQGKTANEP